MQHTLSSTPELAFRGISSAMAGVVLLCAVAAVTQQRPIATPDVNKSAVATFAILQAQNGYGADYVPTHPSASDSANRAKCRGPIPDRHARAATPRRKNLIRSDDGMAVRGDGIPEQGPPAELARPSWVARARLRAGQSGLRRP